VSFAEQAAGLAAVEEAIVGVGRAFAEAPNALQPADLPAFVNLPGPCREEWEMSDEQGVEAYETRVWDCRLHVAPRAAGTSGEVWRLCEPFFATCRDAFQGHQSLGGVVEVLKVTFLGDGGAQELTYAGMPYAGIRFRVQVVTRIRVRYAQGE
jgi:hypothetical protein